MQILSVMSLSASKLTGDRSTRKIVVVDDNEILLRAWKRILSDDLLIVFATDNPDAALDYLEREGADLLISDIVMPRTDGFDLIEKVQHLRKRPRIVLTTGYVCDFTRLKLEVGEQDVHVLMKPYNDIHRIEEFVRRLLDDDASLDDDEDSFRSLDDARVHLWSL